MDRYWLLSSSFYGNWLPGDPRGFVGRVRDGRPDDPPVPSRLLHDLPGTPYDADLPGLHRAAKTVLRSPPVRVTVEQARALVAQFRETASYRGWQLLAAAVTANHVHLVTGVPGDPDPTKVLGDYKAYGSRALNRRWGRPPAGTWWTYDGSKRKLRDERAVRDAVVYVRDQPYALVVWIDPGFLL
ncbi:MAG TPA: transposase [Gemmataceae bacterium]|jgi:REP element-mobilizing transposase RayT